MMPISFLAPAFLAGLAALVVPIVIHLTRRQKTQPVAFPSLMFVRQIPFRSERRRRIRNWLLFAIRCAVLILLAAAFARPFLGRTEDVAAAALLGSREMTILLDRSYSMAYADRWERAREAARTAINGLGSDTRATLILFDAGAETVTEATGDPARLLAALERAEIGSSATRYAPALKLAGGILSASDRPRREVVLISDFQRTGWDGEAAVRLPAGTALSPVAITDASTTNASVAGVSFARESVSGRERVRASARLVNTGNEQFGDLPVTLELNGREVQTRSVTLEPNGATTVEFGAVPLAGEEVRGAVRIPDDNLVPDNTFRFVLSPTQGIGVLVVDPTGVGERGSLYLRQALALGEEPGFRVERENASQFGAGDLAGRSVVVLNDAGFPPGQAGVALKSFVEEGGGLVVVLGERSAPDGWQGAGAELLPASFGAPLDRIDDGGVTLGSLDYSHPVWELFSAPRSGDFAPARFFRYREMSVDGDGVLARFSDGAVALAEHRVGQGRVLVWTSTLDSFWNDLALQPVFLPFVHQLVRYASGYAEQRTSFTAGQVLQLASGADDLALAPSGTRIPLQQGGTLLKLDEQGFYEIRRERSTDAEPGVIAVNPDPAESDLASFDPAELVLAVSPGGLSEGVRTGSSGAAGLLTPEDRERRQGVWWYLLAGVFLLLFAEGVLANRFPRAGGSTGGSRDVQSTQ